MKVAITGASGHVGNALCKELIHQGASIKALLFEDEDDLNKPEIELIRGNINNLKNLEDLCKGADIVFHLAAKISINKSERDLVFKVNVDGTKNIIKASLNQKVKRFIHFSSIHAITQEPLEEILTEDRPLIDNTKIAYEQSKTEGERLVLKAVKEGLNASIITPTAIIGPYDHKPSLLGQALMKIYNNQLPMLVSGGYNWVDVRDIVNGAILAAEKGRKGEKYILSGHYSELSELSNLIGKVTGRKTPRLIAPTVLAKIGIPFIHVYSKIRNEHPLYTMESLEILKNSNKQISSNKALEAFGYSPRPLKETLSDTFDWYKKNRMVN